MSDSLTKSQFRALSSLALDIGKFIFVALVIGYFIPGSFIRPGAFLFATVISTGAFAWGIILARKEDIL